LSKPLKKKKKLRSPNHIPNKKPSRGGEPFPVQQIKTKTHKKKKQNSREKEKTNRCHQSREA
jgi:hypothetical protein